MRIIPAIDIIDGKCVRLTRGDYSSLKVYNENPLEVAKAFEAHGLKFLHLVDLDGAKSNHLVNHKVLYQIAKNTKLKIDFGGGLKSTSDLNIAFENGASQITGGSVALLNPGLFSEWLQKFGPEKIILGADAKNRKVAAMGWMESSKTDVVDFIAAYEKKGIKYVVCTDISKDGMLQGPALDLYREILSKTKTCLIASGGITSLEDLKSLQDSGCEGAIIGKAIYENKIRLEELKDLC